MKTPYTVQVLTALITFSLLMLSSCSEFEGEGDNIIVTQDVNSFSKIDIDLPCDVFIEYGSEQLFTIEGQANVINNMDINVESNMLRVDFNREPNSYNRITLRLVMPEMRELSAHDDNDINISSNITSESNMRIETTGNANIIITDTTRCHNFYYEGSGSSTLQYDYLFCEDFNYKVTGYAECTIKGECLKSTLNITGESKFEGFELLSSKTILNIDGLSETTNIYATEELDIDVEGKATVRYKGSPSIVVTPGTDNGTLDLEAAE